MIVMMMAITPSLKASSLPLLIGFPSTCSAVVLRDRRGCCLCRGQSSKYHSTPPFPCDKGARHEAGIVLVGAVRTGGSGAVGDAERLGPGQADSQGRRQDHRRGQEDKGQGLAG